MTLRLEREKARLVRLNRELGADLERWSLYFSGRGRRREPGESGEPEELGELLRRNLNYLRVTRPFLPPSQRAARLYSSLGIPHVCGRVDKSRLRILGKAKLFCQLDAKPRRAAERRSEKGKGSLTEKGRREGRAEEDEDEDYDRRRGLPVPGSGSGSGSSRDTVPLEDYRPPSFLPSSLEASPERESPPEKREAEVPSAEVGIPSGPPLPEPRRCRIVGSSPFAGETGHRPDTTAPDEKRETEGNPTAESGESALIASEDGSPSGGEATGASERLSLLAATSALPESPSRHGVPVTPADLESVGSSEAADSPPFSPRVEKEGAPFKTDAAPAPAPAPALLGRERDSFNGPRSEAAEPSSSVVGRTPFADPPTLPTLRLTAAPPPQEEDEDEDEDEEDEEVEEEEEADGGDEEAEEEEEEDRRGSTTGEISAPTAQSREVSEHSTKSLLFRKVVRRMEEMFGPPPPPPPPPPALPPLGRDESTFLGLESTTESALRERVAASLPPAGEETRALADSHVPPLLVPLPPSPRLGEGSDAAVGSGSDSEGRPPTGSSTLEMTGRAARSAASQALLLRGGRKTQEWGKPSPASFPRSCVTETLTLRRRGGEGEGEEPPPNYAPRPHDPHSLLLRRRAFFMSPPPERRAAETAEISDEGVEIPEDSHRYRGPRVSTRALSSLDSPPVPN